LDLLLFLGVGVEEVLEVTEEGRDLRFPFQRELAAIPDSVSEFNW
jgi:hypothetical protein